MSTPVYLLCVGYSMEVKESYWKLRRKGWSQRQAANRIGISPKTGAIWDRAEPNTVALIKEQQRLARMPQPKTAYLLLPEAQRGLTDFSFWRRRYLGRRSVPWQEEAASRIVDWLSSDRTEYIVMNVPPGAGKTTLWTDLMAWLICRDREIRILFGSRTAALAEQPVNRVRTLLARSRPVRDATACLAEDYGRFQPESKGLWTRSAFTVLALDGQPLEDKEPTCTGYGMESEFLGHRGDLVLWDDLVVGSTLKNIDQVEAQRKWWEEEGSTRVEPGGALVLNGQRMGPDDLYRYSLDQKLEDTDESRWGHVVYPAHDDESCRGEKFHTIDAPAWPDGCLLDPIRLPWRGPSGLLTIQRNRADKYRVQYQQEETDPATVLVDPVWIDGGFDRDGVNHPGCWDNHRGAWDIPRGLSHPYYCIATVDPSASNFWAMEFWIYHPASEQRFLIDLLRTQMDAPDLLDWNANSGTFFGVMEDWQTRSTELGVPISHWIIETNAAQRYLLQYDHVHRWTRLRGVSIIPHSTGMNKLDAELGIESIRNRFRFGNVRLPGGTDTADFGLGRKAAMQLVTEATRYPSAATDDCLMAMWFLEFHIPTLAREVKPMPRLKRPSWMRPVMA